MNRPPNDDRRVTSHPILGPLPAVERVPFTWNGQPLVARAGEPIGAALLAAGVRVLRRSERAGSSRGIFCNIGHCFECRVEVDGVRDIRACLTPVRAGMVVRSQRSEAEGDTGPAT
jgi:sarcosine oxidase, subunit alpha